MPDLRFCRPEAGQEAALAEVRARSMRPSLQAAGRYHEVRVRQRFLDAYDRDKTWVVRWGEEVAGFFVVEEREGDAYLAHLYLEPDHQGRGIGTAVVAWVKDHWSDRTIRLNALKDSPANAFYRSQGFVAVREDDVDRFYEYRPAGGGV